MGVGAIPQAMSLPQSRAMVPALDRQLREYRAIAAVDDLRAVSDYVAGMTDRYAKNLFQQLFIPHSVHY